MALDLTATGRSGASASSPGARRVEAASREWRKPVVFVERLPLRHLFSVAAIEDIERHHRDADVLGRYGAAHRLAGRHHSHCLGGGCFHAFWLTIDFRPLC